MKYRSLLVALMFAALAVPAVAHVRGSGRWLRKLHAEDAAPAASRVERKRGRECGREAETDWKDSRKPWG